MVEELKKLKVGKVIEQPEMKNYTTYRVGGKAIAIVIPDSVDNLINLIKYLDENPGKKTAQVQYTKIGENVYYSEFTTQILKRIGIKTNNEDVKQDDKEILLKEGDIITVEVKNENSTAAQTLKSSFIGFSNAGEYAISASSSGMVTVNGVKN